MLNYFFIFFSLNLFIDVCKLKKGTGGIYVTIYVCVCVKFNMPHDVGAIAKPIGRLMTGLADGAPPQASALVAVGSQVEPMAAGAGAFGGSLLVFLVFGCSWLISRINK